MWSTKIFPHYLVMVDCELSLFFFRFYVKGVCARERRAAATRENARPEKKKETTAFFLVPLLSRAFSHARGRLRVSLVLLDEPRRKRDCS